VANFNNVPVILGANEYEAEIIYALYGWRGKRGPTQRCPHQQTKPARLLDVAFTAIRTLDDAAAHSTGQKDTYEITGYQGGRAWRAKYVDPASRLISPASTCDLRYDFRRGTQSGRHLSTSSMAAGHAAGHIVSSFGRLGEVLFELPVHR